MLSLHPYKSQSLFSLNPAYHAAFKLFDTDGDGAMTLDELTKVMRSLGRDLDESELRNILQEFDVNCK